AEHAGERHGDGAAEEHEEQRDDGEARHALVRYSGRQRSRRISTCLMPNAITTPMNPSVSSATIMSAAFSVPSDWMIRSPRPPPDSPPRNSPTTTPMSAKEMDGVTVESVICQRFSRTWSESR